MVAKLVSGSTANGKNAKSAVANLRAYIGDTVEVKANGENFVGELVSVEERTLNDGTQNESVIGAVFVVDKRKLGGTVQLSTAFKDDDFGPGDYVKPF